MVAVATEDRKGLFGFFSLCDFLFFGEYILSPLHCGDPRRMVHATRANFLR
jgi:hypothetical protein